MLFVVLAPLAFSVLALLDPLAARRPRALLAGGLTHLAGVGWLIVAAPSPALHGWLELDPLAKVVLPVISLLFAACSVYAQGYLARRRDRDNRLFVGGLLILLSAMTVVATSQHLGLSWVAIELTTLSTAPLIYFDKSARALEAAWKYLLVCSLGIALALLGTFFLALASASTGGPHSLLLSDLVRAGHMLSQAWVRAGFAFLLVGYGTKMGLAPLHSWKPDAYGEAPGILGALLSGGVTSLGFVSLARVVQVCSAAGEAAFARDALVAMGLFSMGLASVYVIGQRDFKRMLAYSSVEHMGILAFGLGLGGVATSSAMFHAVNNALTKGVLFLAAGNIHRSYGSKLVDEVRGAARRLPVSGSLFLAGFLAITGSPPFGPFFSEFSILNGALGAGRYAVGALYLIFLSVIFVGMGATVLKVVPGDPAGAPEVANTRDSLATAGPPLFLMALVLALGLHLPRGLKVLFDAAAARVGT